MIHTSTCIYRITGKREDCNCFLRPLLKINTPSMQDDHKIKLTKKNIYDEAPTIIEDAQPPEPWSPQVSSQGVALLYCEECLRRFPNAPRQAVVVWQGTSSCYPHYRLRRE